MPTNPKKWLDGFFNFKPKVPQLRFTKLTLQDALDEAKEMDKRLTKRQRAIKRKWEAQGYTYGYPSCVESVGTCFKREEE